jgi:hypothetical protein
LILFGFKRNSGTFFWKIRQRKRSCVKVLTNGGLSAAIRAIGVWGKGKKRGREMGRRGN